MKTFLPALLLIATFAQAQSNLPNTDVYLVNIELKDSVLTTKETTPISTSKLYDNQPFFSFDGYSILYSSVQEGVNPDIYLYSTQSNSGYPFFESYNESKFWPQYTADGLGYSIVNRGEDGKQMLWKYFNDARTPINVVPSVTDIGNYCWISDEYLIYRRELNIPTLNILNLKTGETKTIAEGVGVSLAKVPGEKSVYYIKTQQDKSYLMIYQIEENKSTEIINLFNGTEDFCTTVYGDVWVIRNGSIYSYISGSKRLIKIYTFTNDILKNTYRIALNRTLTQMAVVVKTTN
jgi:hypothetical protein